ncbi:hypothetical protein [Kineococcus indalonis]|uniref:hypothetical protein n=1 Tax=Kineococcus indalonis TaxID=2696566 RepID=UPI001412F741|nr:hypothetical protein [Kineococcus indalonis]NAZ88249.1 hypothetical protein [Kineococcus indalonis]
MPETTPDAASEAAARCLRAARALARAVRVRQRSVDLLVDARVTQMVSELRRTESYLGRERSVLGRLDGQLSDAEP